MPREHNVQGTSHLINRILNSVADEQSFSFFLNNVCKYVVFFIEFSPVIEEQQLVCWVLSYLKIDHSATFLPFILNNAFKY